MRELTRAATGARGATAALLCGLTLISGCGEPSGGAGTSPDSQGADRMEAGHGTWFVTLGSRGGFTGGGSGYIVHASGRVMEWSQITPGDSTTHSPVGRATPEAIAALAAAVRAPDLQASKLQETGNMTTFLEWHDAGRMLRWSWPERGGPGGADAKVPPPIRQAWTAARAAVESARAAGGDLEESQ